MLLERNHQSFLSTVGFLNPRSFQSSKKRPPTLGFISVRQIKVIITLIFELVHLLRLEKLSNANAECLVPKGKGSSRAPPKCQEGSSAETIKNLIHVSRYEGVSRMNDQ